MNQIGAKEMLTCALGPCVSVVHMCVASPWLWLWCPSAHATVYPFLNCLLSYFHKEVYRVFSTLKEVFIVS